MRSTARLSSVVAVIGLAAIAFFALQAGGGADSCLARSDAPGKASAAKSVQKRIPRAAATQPTASRPAAATRPSATTQPSPQKIIVYYFHRTMRCPTCTRIEELAKQAVEAAFPGELVLGSVEWKPINIQLPDNKHFEKDYKLEFQSLVLVRTDHGRQAGWKNLPKIWDLVGDSAAFTKYVQDELRAYLYGEAANPR